MLANFLELNSKGQYESSRQGKQSSYLVFPSSTKREIMHFHMCKVVVLLYLNLLLFCHSCCHHRRCCLSFLLFLKGLCHICLVHFVNNANCGSFLAMELEKLIENCQANKFSKSTTQSVSIFFNFINVFLLLYLLCYLESSSFYVLSSYFCVSLSLVAVTTF